jgi:hypothetical protein
MLVAPLLATGTALARSAGYDVVLLAHVLSALIGLGAVVVAGGFALALARSGPSSESIRRYYRSGINWGGRVLFLVPVFGVVLISMSKGVWSFSDGWIVGGLALWSVAALGGEMVLWPAERQLQIAVNEPDAPVSLRSQCLVVMTTAVVMVIVLLVATVMMVAKP